MELQGNEYCLGSGRCEPKQKQHQGEPDTEMHPIGWLRSQFHDKRKKQDDSANTKYQKGSRAISTVFAGEVEIAAFTTRSDFEKGLVK